MEKRINWLAVVLIICLLTACGKKQEVKLPALSDSLKQEIEEARGSYMEIVRLCGSTNQMKVHGQTVSATMESGERQRLSILALC